MPVPEASRSNIAPKFFLLTFFLDLAFLKEVGVAAEENPLGMVARMIDRPYARLFADLSVAEPDPSPWWIPLREVSSHRHLPHACFGCLNSSGVNFRPMTASNTVKPDTARACG